MKFLKKVSVIVCVISWTIFLTVQAHAITLDFVPVTSSIGIGDSFTVDLVISGLANDNVSGFDFFLDYDSSIVSFDSYVFGDNLGDIASGEAFDFSFDNNLAEVSGLWNFSFQPDSFTLVSLSFTGLSLGTSSLGISSIILSDDSLQAQPLAFSINTGSIDVAAPVPEPATMILFGTGLAGLAAVRRRKEAC